MRPRHHFICAGCNEDFVLGDPRDGDQTMACPVPECARPVWIRHLSEPVPPRGRLLLGTTEGPEPADGPYAVDRCRLLLEGEEILTGPREILVTWSRFLNDSRPSLNELADVIRQLIQSAERGVYVPGPVLIRAGRLSIANRGK